jgi:hypothetical protein
MKSISLKPGSKLGWWAIGLAVAYFVLMPMWSFLGSLGAWPAFLCGFAGGILGLIAVIRQQERSWLVYLACLPLLLVMIFFLGEFLIPH